MTTERRPPWTEAIAAPLRLYDTRVKPEWIDEFNHVNIAHYLTICDQANWRFWNWVNAPQGTMEARRGHEYIIVENHVHYIDELPLDEPIYVTTQLLSLDDKRYILFHSVYKTSGDTLSATNEVKCLGFDLGARRPEPWRSQVKSRLDAILSAHQGLGQPEGAGLGIALKRR